MAFNAVVRDNEMADMNITPLVDVMLVLLVIFMVTMPLRTHSIAIDLPQPGPPVHKPVASPILLRIQADGQLTWNGSALPISTLEATMKVEAARYPNPAEQPFLNIDTDNDARYDKLTTVLASAKNAGLVRIGFVENER
jgi:biopolymer transport protein ExbD